MSKARLIAVTLWSVWTMSAAPTILAIPIDPSSGESSSLLASPWMEASLDRGDGSESDLGGQASFLYASDQVHEAVIQLDWHLVMPQPGDPVVPEEQSSSRATGKEPPTPPAGDEHMDFRDLIRPYINVAVSRPEWATEDVVQAPVAGRESRSANGQPSQDYPFEDLWYTLLGALLNTLLEPTAESESTIGFSILGLGHFIVQWRRENEELVIIELMSGSLWSFKRAPGRAEYGEDPTLTAMTEDDFSRIGYASGIPKTIVHSIIAWLGTKFASILNWFRQSVIYVYIIPVPIMLIAVFTAVTLSDRRGRRLFHHGRR